MTQSDTSLSRKTGNEPNRDTSLFSSKQNEDRQQQLARQRLVSWQQKDQSELSKVKEQLNTLETGTKPVPVSDTSIGALQVCLSWRYRDLNRALIG